MSNLSIQDLLSMQQELQKKYEGVWEPVSPARGRNQMLWMIEEIGEAIAIIKKRGDTGIMQDAAVRAAFMEEMTDVLMYYTDVLLCYDVSAEEFCSAYQKKHDRNMHRDFQGEHMKYLNKEGT